MAQQLYKSALNKLQNLTDGDWIAAFSNNGTIAERIVISDFIDVLGLSKAEDVKNFASHDLIFTANRSHNLKDKDLILNNANSIYHRVGLETGATQEVTSVMTDSRFLTTFTSTTTNVTSLINIGGGDATLSYIAPGYSQEIQSGSSGNIISSSRAETAALKINSTVGGFLMPTVTTVQRDAMSAANGWAVYNTTTSEFNYYNGTSWNPIGADTNFATTDLTLDANRTHDLAGFNALLDNGFVGINTNGATTPNTRLQVFIDSDSERGIRLNNLATNSQFSMWTRQITGTNAFVLDSDNSGNTVLIIDEAQNMGVGLSASTLPQSRLHVKGDGATSATTTLLVENSSLTQLLKIDDAGGFALGDGATYSDYRAVTIGSEATTTSYGVAIGRSASVDTGVAIGYNAAAATVGVAIGESATGYGVAVGRNALAAGFDRVAVGYGAVAGNYGAAIGFGATVSKGFSGGYQATSSGAGIAIGESASSNSGIAIGRNSSNTGLSIAMGDGAKTTASHSLIFSTVSSGSIRTNSTASSTEFYLNSATPTFRFGETVDGWLNSTGNFGLGLNTGIGAKLHVKGSGATSATKALLAENGNGDNIFEISDDSVSKFSGPTTITPTDVLTFFDRTNVSTYGAIGTDNGATYFNVAGSHDELDFRVNQISSLKINTDRTINVSTLGAGANVDVLGRDVNGTLVEATSFSGSFSGSFQGDGSQLTGIAANNISNADLSLDANRTTSMNGFVLNFEGANTRWRYDANGYFRAFKVSDGVEEFSYNPITGGSATFGRTTSKRVKIGHNEGDIRGYSNATNLNYYLHPVFDNYICGDANDLGIGLKTNPGAKVHIQGNGATSATTALLVENSLGTDLLKIDDDGSFDLGEGNSLAAHDKFATVVGQGNTTIGLTGSTLGIYGYNNSLTKSGNLNNYTYIFGGGNTVNNSGSTSYIFNTVLGSLNSQTNGIANFLGGSRHTNTGNSNTNLGYQNTSQGFAATLGVFLESSANYADVWGFGWSSVDKFTNTQTKSLEIGWEIKSTDTAPFRFAQTSDSWINGSGGLGVGTSSVDSSAQLDVSSTTKGFLLPRMTTTQKNAISSPASGLMVYDTTLSKLCVYTGAAWETITSA